MRKNIAHPVWITAIHSVLSLVVTLTGEAIMSKSASGCGMESKIMRDPAIKCLAPVPDGAVTVKLANGY